MTTRSSRPCRSATLSGDLTMDELIDIAKQVVDKTKVQYGILASPEQGTGLHHGVPVLWQRICRPENRAPAPRTRQARQRPSAGSRAASRRGVIPANNTAMEFDALRKQFYTGNAVFWMYGIWDLGTYAVSDLRPALRTRPAFFADWGWIAAPAPKKGGAPGSLTHPIIYAVAARAADPELAVRLLGHASAADLNTDHAVTTTHLGIKPEQLEDPRYAKVWPLARATELLKITRFLPNNPQFGDLNGIVSQRLARRGNGPVVREGRG